MIVSVLHVFLTVPLVGLQFVIVVFSDYTHLLFVKRRIKVVHIWDTDRLWFLDGIKGFELLV